MAILKRFFFNNSTEMDDFVADMSLGTDHDAIILSRIRSTFNRLNFHSGRAKYGKFSMTIDYTSGEVRLEYDNMNGRKYTRKVYDVVLRNATPFQQLRTIFKLDFNTLRRLNRNKVFHYTGK